MKMKMTAPLSIQIVPAQPGYYTIYNLDEKLALGEQVIAWRIETYSTDRKNNVFSVCVALTVDGEITSNCIGVQNPDNTVTVFADATYRSLDELQATCREN